ncbi:pyruvate kinase [Candidatus Uhrbacteria bacterium]|jgi:pyruvate kinase|nr:pyruvate kinase [Candidatus Uhrbacteria bacterium]MBT7716753.1 pyruvate kinase [Candidatus Uhrbacteria bacterium]
MKRRTKIVATIGPASSSVTTLVRMIRAGMDVARLNFSHGSYADHKALVKHIRSAANKTGRIVAVLQDLQGPKIRIGTLPKKGIELHKGQEVHLSTAVDSYEPDGPIPVTYKNLHKDVKKGHRLFINDGFIETVVESVRGKVVKVKVVNGGPVISNKGINLPDSVVSAPAMTQKDHEDLMFGLEQGVDFVALSFVTSAQDIKALRRIVDAKCRALGCISPKIIAKIERPEAVEDFAEILEVIDGAMIARGDLGVEIKPEQVPIVQKEMIEQCREVGKPVIVATHMMESMISNPRATRAETSDVANAIIDHTDAVMLSGETATGEYPYTVVKTMAAIIDEAEKSRFDDISFYQIHDLGKLPKSIAQSVHMMADNKQIDFIATSSSFKSVSATINIFRPNVPIIMGCPNRQIARQMVLRAGVHPVVLSDEAGTFMLRMERYLRRNKIATKKSHVAYVTAVASGEVQLIVR